VSPRAPIPAVALAAVALACAGPARAYFEEVAVGARQIACGQTGQAAVADVSAYHWNPAGLAGLEGYAGFLDYARPYGVEDLAANAIAVGGRAFDTGVAVAWHRFGLADVYAEDLFCAAAGRTLARPLNGHTLDGGVTLKVARVSFQPFTIQGTTASVDYGARTEPSLDLGLRWSTPWRMSFAWVGRDLTSPDFEFQAGSGAGELPARQEFGLAYAWNPQSTVFGGWSETDAAGSTNLNLGLEVWFYEVFAIRSGLANVREIARSDGLLVTNDEFRYTGGVGVKHRGWEIDMAAVTHRRLGASYRASLRWAGRGGDAR